LVEGDNPYAARLSVVDQRLRQTLTRHSAKAEASHGVQEPDARKDGPPRAAGQLGGDQGRPDQDMITPYVIVNKTDLIIVAHRLQKRATNVRQSFQDLLKAQIEHEISGTQ